MKQIVIAGGPRTGKSTLSNALGQHLRIRPEQVAHTDDLVGVLSWSDSSAEVARWIYDQDPYGPQIVEGVAVSRALRKGALDRPETERPCTVLVHLTFPFEKLTDGQSRMAKGEQTVYSEIRDDLLLRGVCLVEPVRDEIERVPIERLVAHLASLLQLRGG
jgi:hypothetical protein